MYGHTGCMYASMYVCICVYLYVLNAQCDENNQKIDSMKNHRSILFKIIDFCLETMLHDQVFIFHFQNLIFENQLYKFCFFEISFSKIVLQNFICKNKFLQFESFFKIRVIN